jgi:hypothetical protein
MRLREYPAFICATADANMREERWALTLAYLENVHGLDWSRPLVVQ